MTTFLSVEDAMADNVLSIPNFVFQVIAVCLEIQETESATLITFFPYYAGSVPLLVINHFPNVSMHFAQNKK